NWSWGYNGLVIALGSDRRAAARLRASRFVLNETTDFNMAPENELLINEVARRLANVAPGAKVILFGSRARDEEGPDSDLDLLVIEPGEVEKPRAESSRLRRELRGLGVSLDLIVVSARYAKEWEDFEGTLVNQALSEGRVLVDA